jgi:hypothetical protein
VRPRQIVGWGAEVHAGVVQDEVFEMHERALKPQAGAGVDKMRAADPALPDRALAQPVVEARQRVFGRGERAGERCPGQRIGEGVSH